MRYLSSTLPVFLLAIHLLMQKQLFILPLHIILALLIAFGVGFLFRHQLTITYRASDLALYFGQLIVIALYYWSIPTVIPLLLFVSIELYRIFIMKDVKNIEKKIGKLMEEQEHANETFKIIRSERHDFLKHISSLHFTLEKEEYKEAKLYLDQLVGTYEETNLSIKGEKGVIAGILNDTYRRAKNLNMSPYFDLDIPISSLPLKDVDKVSLIGNILSNAMDACEEWREQREQPALLMLEFSKRSGLYILECKNSSLPIPPAVLDHLYNSYGVTTKGAEHEGLGTKIIHNITKSYHGFLDFTYKDEQFTVKIKMPALIE